MIVAVTGTRNTYSYSRLRAYARQIIGEKDVSTVCFALKIVHLQKDKRRRGDVVRLGLLAFEKNFKTSDGCGDDTQRVCLLSTSFHMRVCIYIYAQIPI